MSDEEFAWTQGPKQLIFERDGLLIRMTSFSFPTEEGLISIAESMERGSARGRGQ